MLCWKSWQFELPHIRQQSMSRVLCTYIWPRFMLTYGCQYRNCAYALHCFSRVLLEKLYHLEHNKPNNNNNKQCHRKRSSQGQTPLNVQNAISVISIVAYACTIYGPPPDVPKTLSMN